MYHLKASFPFHSWKFFIKFVSNIFLAFYSLPLKLHHAKKYLLNAFSRKYRKTTQELFERNIFIH